MTEQKSTFGVQNLIDRLSEEGVAEGRRRSDELVQQAEQKADTLIESARAEAARIVQTARLEADRLQEAGEEALRLAKRDAIRDLAARIHSGFRNRLQALIHCELVQPELLKQMILEVTRQSTSQVSDEPVNVLIPADAITEEESRRRLEDGDSDVLTDFVKALVAEDLRDGVTVDLGSRTHAGMAVRVVNDNLEIDLGDEAIGELLSLHLLPRFRAIMRHG